MGSNKTKGDVRDLSLARDGVNRIEWAEREMGVLRLIKERFSKVVNFKPQASRSDSSEKFVVCQGFKGLN